MSEQQKPANGSSPSDWLELLMRCQNGETTCMRVMQIIERETVSKSWVVAQQEEMRQLCYAIEELPAGKQQTELSIKASAISQEMQRVIQFKYCEDEKPAD